VRFWSRLADETWGYATDATLLFTLLVHILCILLKSPWPGSTVEHCLVVPCWLAKLLQRKRGSLYSERCWAGRSWEKLLESRCSRCGWRRRQSRQGACGIGTDYKREESDCFLQGTESQTGLKDDGRKRYGCQSFAGAQKPQNTAGWENSIGRKDMAFFHGLAVGLFSDFCGLNFPL